MANRHVCTDEVECFALACFPNCLNSNSFAFYIHAYVFPMVQASSDFPFRHVPEHDRGAGLCAMSMYTALSNGLYKLR